MNDFDRLELTRIEGDGSDWILIPLSPDRPHCESMPPRAAEWFASMVQS